MLRCVGPFSFYTLVSGIKGDNICTFTEKMSPRTRMHLYRVPYYNNLHTLQTPGSTRHAPDSQRNIFHRRQKHVTTSKNLKKFNELVEILRVFFNQKTRFKKTRKSSTSDSHPKKNHKLTTSKPPKVTSFAVVPILNHCFKILS